MRMRKNFGSVWGEMDDLGGTGVAVGSCDGEGRIYGGLGNSIKW